MITIEDFKTVPMLTAEEEQMVTLHLIDGNSKVESYIIAFKVAENYNEGEEIDYKKEARRANYRFRKPAVREYYDKLFDEISREATKAAQWTAELSTLVNKEILFHAKDLILDGKATMATVKAYEVSNKELNAIHGLTTKKQIELNAEAKVSSDSVVVFKEDLVE